MILHSINQSYWDRAVVSRFNRWMPPNLLPLLKQLTCYYTSDDLKIKELFNKLTVEGKHALLYFPLRSNITKYEDATTLVKRVLSEVPFTASNRPLIEDLCQSYETAINLESRGGRVGCYCGNIVRQKCLTEVYKALRKVLKRIPGQ